MHPRTQKGLTRKAVPSTPSSLRREGRRRERLFSQRFTFFWTLCKVCGRTLIPELAKVVLHNSGGQWVWLPLKQDNSIQSWVRSEVSLWNAYVISQQLENKGSHFPCYWNSLILHPLIMSETCSQGYNLGSFQQSPGPIQIWVFSSFRSPSGALKS